MWKARFCSFVIAHVAVISAACSLAPPAAALDYLQQGIKEFNSGRHREALNSFYQASRAKPELPTPIYYSALCYEKLKDCARAQSLFADLVKRFPDTPEAKLAGDYLNRLTKAPPEQAVGEKAQFSDKAAPKVERLPEQLSFPFRRSQGGHLLVSGSINGRGIDMIFDTGASSMCISETDVTKTGIKFSGPSEDISSGGVGGAVKGKKYEAEISIGSLKRQTEIMVLPGYQLPPLIGHPMFKEYNYTIDNRAGLITFSKRNSRYDMPMDSIVIPYEQSGKLMLVQAEIDGVKVPMVFDTGATSVVIPVSSIPAGAKVGYSTGVGGKTLSYEINAGEVRLGALRRSAVRCTGILQPMPFGLLGQEFIGDRRYQIDPENRIIKFAR